MGLFFGLLIIAYCAAVVGALVRTQNINVAFPPEGDFIEVEGRKVHAVIRGSGPDLILIHGSNGNTRDFTFQISKVLSSRYRVIILDRPGLGHSDRLPIGQETITDQARHLKKAADKIGTKKPILLGHSYGGAVALAWAVEFPETGAIVNVAAPALPWTSALATVYRVLSNPIGSAIAVPFASALARSRQINTAIAEVFAPQEPPEGYVEHFGADLALRPMTLRANAIQRANLLSEMTALQPEIRKLTLPIELVHGSADTTVGLEIHARPLSKILPNANLIELEGAGHMPQHTHMSAVIDAIDQVAARAGLR